MRPPKFPTTHDPDNAQPFETVSEAWFWFIQAQQARNEGARYKAGMGLTTRPCEPTDILKVLDRLYRNRILLRDHLLVLRHYGRRQMPPDRHRAKEVRAYYLWQEALAKIEPALIRKKIVREKEFHVHPHEKWIHEAVIYENYQQSRCQ